MASKSISLANYIQSSPTLLKLIKPVANAYAHAAGYRQFGLRYDDLLEEENFQTQKALSRLEPPESYDRVFRFRRAVQCSIANKPLPKEEWIKPSEDVRYLTPLLEEIQRADDERHAWDTASVKKDH
ncbi:Cytochrome b-c1 complex subunit 7 [Malassezia psittaci]|uniref:Cytochrome b-c1 complex subunit 7 n=1 Tax=Malassezia psittaci TaxID=1821823 RepID=A0AAF0JCS7_9BASI|nr:Cytochrome b-c1 complex subunit 7 [Malassezia psittaci]